jgi:hypothetical protein
MLPFPTSLPLSSLSSCHATPLLTLQTWNAVLLALSGYSACWLVPKDSVFVILVGWNMEILLLFSISGFVYVNVISAFKKGDTWLGVNNRLSVALCFSLLCLLVELCLNAWDNALAWDYTWWNASFPVLIFFFGYFHFFAFTWCVYDMPSTHLRCLAVSYVLAVNVAATAIFGFGLGYL